LIVVVRRRMVHRRGQASRHAGLAHRAVCAKARAREGAAHDGHMRETHQRNETHDTTHDHAEVYPAMMSGGSGIARRR
jgi:hypothetical protein